MSAHHSLSPDDVAMVASALCLRAGRMAHVLYRNYMDVVIHGKEEGRAGLFVESRRKELGRIDRHVRLIQRLLGETRLIAYATVAADMTHADLGIEEAEEAVGLIERNTRTRDEERDMGDME